MAPAPTACRHPLLPQWAKPWPCGVELARAVTGAVPAGSRVLELGCGLALPSMAAALGGAHVLATDQAPGALAFADYNARRNHIPLDVASCHWSDPVAAVAGAPWDFVLAADVQQAPVQADAPRGRC
jgi:predicted nicotinamide N-methyase